MALPLAVMLVAASPTPPEDPYLWLEDVTGDKAIGWARERNAATKAELEADPGFAAMKARFLAILDSKDKIPGIEKQGKWFYDFWKDEQHPRGLWRRVPSLAEYKSKAPRWETVLDLDALAAAEKENWVWHGASCLYPKRERCLLMLSRGGADAAVVREFDVVKKAFVEGGFVVPEAKSSVAWKDLDTVFVATDFGPGTLNDSGYPRLLKQWRRGTPLSEAKLIHEGKTTDIELSGYRVWDHGRTFDVILRSIDFYTSESWLNGTRIDVPISAKVSTWDDQLLVTLRDDWSVGGKTWPKGSLLAAPLDAFMKGARDFHVLFEPAANKALAGIGSLKSAILVNEMEDVHNKLYAWTRPKGAWERLPIRSEGLGTLLPSEVEPDDSDDYFLQSTGFTEPTTLSFVHFGKPPELLKRSPTFFDATGLVVEQHFATSKDGTKVPYFQVSRKDLKLDGENPTLLTGYGGFEITVEPVYNAIGGAGWLEKGGVYVSANIRGGGEYGPAWHQAAIKLHRQRAYDDFIAIAEDLIARKVTTPRRLGISGGSNGGLLMGVMLTQRPELFGAVVCSVPLLDMKRYNKLLAGASWMAEYGDPAVPEEWAAIARYSPYQNVKKGVKYPRTLFTTSTRDDRVHPGHARKMVARMLEQGHDVLYYENIEGGHGGAANNEQRAYMSALGFTFLARQLGLSAR